MPKVWLRIKNQQGFSPVEVLLAATIFGFLTTALVGAIVYGRGAPASAGDRARAVALAEEGNEAVRNIRDAAFANIADGTYGLVQSGNVWTLSGSSDTSGIYTRQVVIASVDATRKTVTTTVSWPQGSTTAQTSVVGRFTNWQASIAVTPTNGPVMMVYSKTTTIPYYRIWNSGTSTWGAEAAAQTVVGNINYVVVKSARTRNEAIMGVQTSTGAIYIQIWNGTTWGNLTQVGTGPTNTRAFDISYEKNSDHALITFSPVSNSADFAYRTWNGTTLSSATTVTTPPTTSPVNWIEMKQNPLSASDNIALMMMDSTTAVYGMMWTGSAWSDMGVAGTWDTTGTNAVKKAIDVDFEQLTGRAMFIWGDSVATDQYYRIWNGTTLAAATLLDIPAEGGASEWIQLTSRPNSNEIMLGVQDSGADLNTRKWSGSAWDTATQHVEHSAAVENIASRSFDIVYETATANAGKAWLLFGNGTTVSTKLWSGSAWGTATTLASSDDTSFIRLRADTATGAVFAGLYENSTAATKHIWESHLTGGGTTWSAKNTIWTGATGADPVFFRIDIATP